MMDFSFVGSGSGTRRQGPDAQGHHVDTGQAPRGSGPPAVHIPSYTEVAAPQHTSVPLNSLFQPRGLMAAYQQNQQHQQQLQQPPVQPVTAGPALVLHPPPQGGAPAAAAAHPQQPTNHYTAAVGAVSYPAAPGPSNTYQQPLSAADSTLMVVSRRQQGNPILKHIRNVRWVFGDIGPDYQLGPAACALFLSLRYHLLHPTYFMYRIKELTRTWAMRVLLVLVDVEEVVKPLADITKAAALNDCTLVCAWSPEEAGRYLETFKAYQNKPASTIQAHVEGDYVSRLTSSLTAVRAINRTDAMALGAQFSSLSSVLQANKQELSACPGIGPTKVQHLWDAFNKPFRRPAAAAAAPPAVVVRQEPGSGAHGQVVPEQAGQESGRLPDSSMPSPSHGNQPQVDGSATEPQGTVIQGSHEEVDTDMQAAETHAFKRVRVRVMAAAAVGADGHEQPASVAAGRDEVAEEEQGDMSDEGDESDEGEQGPDEHGCVGSPEADDDLVHMATQIMLQVQAGAAVTGVEDEPGEGHMSGQEEGWEEI